MKSFVFSLVILLLALGRPPLTEQSEDSSSGGFALSGARSKSKITGPEESTGLVHVVEQPDSPLKILAISFKNRSFISVSNDRATLRLRRTMKLHNRSDQ